MEPNPIAEIVDLHEFFESWFKGEADPSTFSRFEHVVADEFGFVATDGSVFDRAVMLGSVRNHHGDDQRSIWIENAKEQWRIGDVILTTCEEWQKWPNGDERGRLSSALFRADETAPHGVVWLHVHETWLPKTTEAR